MKEESESQNKKTDIKLMLGFLVVTIVAGGLLAMTAPPIEGRQDVNECLDSGGSFNMKTNECVRDGTTE